VFENFDSWLVTVYPKGHWSHDTWLYAPHLDIPKGMSLIGYMWYVWRTLHRAVVCHKFTTYATARIHTYKHQHSERRWHSLSCYIYVHTISYYSQHLRMKYSEQLKNYLFCFPWCFFNSPVGRISVLKYEFPVWITVKASICLLVFHILLR
jgi:hypothetical protein